MDNTGKFTGKGAVYAAARPRYAEGLLAYLADEAGLSLMWGRGRGSSPSSCRTRCARPFMWGGSMVISKRELELHEEDLLGYSAKDVACHQCGSCCGRRAGRVLDGKPLIMCTRKEAAREVLARLGKRGKGGR